MNVRMLVKVLRTLARPVDLGQIATDGVPSFLNVLASLLRGPRLLGSAILVALGPPEAPEPRKRRPVPISPRRPILELEAEDCYTRYRTRSSDLSRWAPPLRIFVGMLFVAGMVLLGAWTHSVIAVLAPGQKVARTEPEAARVTPAVTLPAVPSVAPSPAARTEDQRAADRLHLGLVGRDIWMRCVTWIPQAAEAVRLMGQMGMSPGRMDFRATELFSQGKEPLHACVEGEPTGSDAFVPSSGTDTGWVVRDFQDTSTRTRRSAPRLAKRRAEADDMEPVYPDYAGPAMGSLPSDTDPRAAEDVGSQPRRRVILDWMAPRNGREVRAVPGSLENPLDPARLDPRAVDWLLVSPSHPISWLQGRATAAGVRLRARLRGGRSLSFPTPSGRNVPLWETTLQLEGDGKVREVLNLLADIGQSRCAIHLPTLSFVWAADDPSVHFTAEMVLMGGPSNGMDEP